jgi:two-component system chemotaxis response regulator CheY
MSKRILIADDAPFMREMLRDILVEGGYEIVAEAGDGVEAVERFKEHSPDLVTLDIVMPRRNGLEGLRGILEVNPAACVVMCSALGQEALVEEALGAGARDFVVKPFKPEEVRSVIERALNKSSEEAAS